MTKAVLLVLLVLVAVCSTQGKPEQKNIPKRGKRIPQTLSRGLFRSSAHITHTHWLYPFLDLALVLILILI